MDLKVDLGLDQERFGQLIQAAILQEIGPEQRDKIITQALEHLTRVPERSGYGYQQKSPLQEAFNSAIDRTAREVVAELVAANLAVRERITQMLGEAVARFLAESYEDSAATVKSAVADVILGNNR